MFYKRGDTWWVKFKSRGKRVRESTGTADRGEAEVQAARIRLKHHSGKTNVAPGQRSTLAQVSAADIARAEGDRVSAKQLEALDYLWRQVLGHFGQDSDPASIDYEAIERYVHARRQAGQRGQSITREVQCLKRGLRIAMRRGWVDSLLPDWPRIKSDPPKVGQAGKWHPVEVIRDWLAVMDPLARLHAAAVAQTGLRSEEMYRGTPEWLVEAPPGVDAAAVVNLPASAAKTRKPRSIPVDQETADMLLTYWSFPDRPRSHQRARVSAAKAIGYSQKITLRDLRHVCATLAEKHDRKAAQDMLGHTTERMTQRYLHSDPERQALAGAAVVAALGLDRGHIGGGTISERHEKVYGRRGFRTPDILRVKPEASSNYDNLRSISDRKRDVVPVVDLPQGPQSGHSKKARR